MMLCYDLHSHSTASDGVLTPAELAQRAARQGVDVLALTDHDVVSGIAEASREAAKSGLCIIPGVEISVTWNKHLIHIVGVGINPEYEPLIKGLARLRETRDWRAKEIGERFDKIGIAGVYDGARRLAKGSIVSRTHFARHLVEQGKAKNIQSVFNHYLGQGKRCYVPCEWADLDQALHWINDAGGQAVVAHPARYNMSATKLRRFLGEFKEAGGVGIEVVTSSHNHDDVKNVAALAQKFDLLASSGSDFHEPGNAWVELGKLPALPSQCTPIWHDWQVTTLRQREYVVQ